MQLVKNINGEHILEPFCTYDYQMFGERRLLDDKLIFLQRQDKCAVSSFYMYNNFYVSFVFVIEKL